MNNILFILMSVVLITTIANYKNRNALIWLVIIAFTNILGLMVLIFLPKKAIGSQRSNVIDFRAVQQQRQERLTSNIVQLLAKLCKSDNVVTKNELDVVEQFLKTHLGLEGEALNQAKRLFNETKRNDTHFSKYVNEIKSVVYHTADLYALIKVMYSVASIDGIRKEEEAMIDETAKYFGIFSTDGYREIKSKYVQSATSIQKYYDILGCKIGSTVSDIKRCYHKKMVEYHPDKFEAPNISQAEKDRAYEKTLEIREAYDMIMKNVQAMA